MKLVDQTLFGDGVGNCFAACVATILGEPLALVPNFCADGGDVWYQKFAEWLNGRGFAPLTFCFPDEKSFEPHAEWATKLGPNVPWIACGDTPRGKHAVVYVGDKLFHDPNPNFGRTGIDRVEDATLLLSAFDQKLSGEFHK